MVFHYAWIAKKNKMAKQTKNTLLNEFIKIQDMQFELDKLKKQQREINKEIKSLSQKIPFMIRTLELK